MKKLAMWLLNSAARFASNSRSRSQSPSDRRLVLLFEGWLVEKEYLDPTQSMDDLAQKWGVGKYEIANFCRLYKGKNFLTWRKELRINEAKNIIKERPDLSVRQVGEMVGIKDVTNFKRQFCEVTGQTVYDFIDKVRPNSKK